MKGEWQRNGLKLHSVSARDRGYHCGPELVLVPLTAGVREFNCLFHSFSAQGPTAKGNSNVGDRRQR